MSKPNRRRLLNPLTPAEPTKMHTLWKCKLRVNGRPTEQEFLFRQTSEFDAAAKTASELIESSTAELFAGAVIIAVEKVGHLWN